jgi:hypothetical protein
VTDIARAHAILAALGLSADTCRAITGEVVRRQGGSWGDRCTERQDLLAIAIDQVWHVLQMQPTAGGGLLRLRVRWAVREALREEAYQHGIVRPHIKRSMLDLPRPERHCRCGKSLGTMALAQVRCCARCQLSLSAESSRRYHERQRQKVA